MGKTHAMVRGLAGLLVLVGLKWLGDAVSGWFQLEVPGSFWGFLFLFLFLCVHRSAPRALSDAASFLLNHLTLFLLPSLVAAAVGLRFASEAAGLLLLSGLVVTVLVAVGCGLVIAALQRPKGADDGA